METNLLFSSLVTVVRFLLSLLFIFKHLDNVFSGYVVYMELPLNLGLSRSNMIVRHPFVFLGNYRFLLQ